jgi:diadenosine tetraphosphate (Ap4A) HIT family hydrolase
MTDAWDVFSKIVVGEEPASFVDEDDVVVAFMDTRPVNRGHVLVIPRKTIRWLADLDDETAGHMFVVGRRIAVAISKTSIRCEGLNLFLADREAGGQEIFHAHLHVTPRYQGDGFGFVYNADYGKPVERAELEAVAAEIRAAIGS